MIKAWIKNSFVDYPGKIAATIFFGGCNFSCPFCHNGELVKRSDSIDNIDFEEIMDYLKKRKKLIDGVVFSGGEATLFGKLENMIERVKGEGYLVKLDTNGYRPEILEKLLEKGLLDYVAMDIKNCPEKYSETAGLEFVDMKQINKSIELLKNSNIGYEFRTTVMKEFHRKEDFEKIAEWLKGSKKYVLQNYRESDNQIENISFSGFEEKELEELIKVFDNKVEEVSYR